MALNPGSRLGPYEISTRIGAGGMGEVFRARDTKLDRDVALKVLPRAFAESDERVARFQREAKLLASLNHPNIGGIYGLEETEGTTALVLELVEGPTLADRLQQGAIPVEEAVKIAIQIADALGAAHDRGVVHRDLKPANIKVRPDGTVKVLDFGLAKHHARVDLDGPTMTQQDGDLQTRPGMVFGTVSYMSPEQVEGRSVDGRSDIFALGVVLYEMLCGRRPFRGETSVSTFAAILRDAPESLHTIQGDVPEAVGQVVLKCLAKRPEDRYASAQDVHRALSPHFAQARSDAVAWRRLAIGAALLVLVATVASGAFYVRSAARANWAREEAIPGIDRLLTEGLVYEALRLYRAAEEVVPESIELHAFDERLRLSPMTIETDPPGARIYLKDYPAVDSEWELLGTSPLKVEGIPSLGYYRIRVELDGFAPMERASPATTLRLELQAEEVTPEGMVWVPGLRAGQALSFGSPIDPPGEDVPAFWFDRHEVTNREYVEFVKAGGYSSEEYWRDLFNKSRAGVASGDARARFVDTSGRVGPATWRFGTYPEGSDDLPVGGVSWYEAAAYCAFLGKSLPTTFHWYLTAGLGGSGGILQLSNFGGQGPQPRGQNQGLSTYGAYDLAGNVKEWTANTTDGGLRHILGGSWNEPDYQLLLPDARDAFDRDASFGIRCAKYVERPAPQLFGAVESRRTFEPSTTPLDEATYAIYREQFAYDRSDLDVRREPVESSPFVRRERVWLRTADGEERIFAHLYLPTDYGPPYQVVMLAGSGGVLLSQSIDQFTDAFQFLVRLGRAVMLPVLRGTLERGPLPTDLGPNGARNLYHDWSEDFGRAIDYLETQPDEFDTARIAYFGTSFGAAISPPLLAVEPRFKTAVLVSGGLVDRLVRDIAFPAEVAPPNYAPRVAVPVLMMNGRDDYVFPYETSQLPLYEALGTREEDKRLRLFEGGHINVQANMELVREIVAWLDDHLGSVER